jgi:hypothetical protein
MPKAVLALVDDLFWKARLAEAATAAGRPISFSADPAALAGLDPAAVEIVVVDLALRRDPFAEISALKRDPTRAKIPVVGYFEHMRVDLHERGTAAGVDRLFARSTFTERLAEIFGAKE